MSERYLETVQERPYRPGRAGPGPTPAAARQRGSHARLVAADQHTRLVSLAAGVASFVILPVLGAVVAAITC